MHGFSAICESPWFIIVRADCLLRDNFYGEVNIYYLFFLAIEIFI